MCLVNRSSKHKALRCPEKPKEFPPVSLCALTVWLSCAVAYNFCFGLEISQIRLLSMLFSAVFLVASICLFYSGKRRITICILGLVLGVASACSHASMLIEQQHIIENEKPIHLSVQIIEDVQESEFGAYCLARAHEKNGAEFKVRVNFTSDNKAKCWEVFETSAVIKKPSERAARYYWQKGCVGSLSAIVSESHRPKGFLGVIVFLRSQCLGLLKQECGNGSILLSSIVLGDRSELFASPIYNTIKRVGLAHMVAVSGAHLSITIACVAFLLLRLRFPRACSIAVQIFFCISYVLFTGASHSALRACAMVFCMLMAFFGKRRPYALNALSLCVLVFLLVNPTLAFSISFILSVLSTAGIVVFAQYFSAWFSELFSSRMPALSSILGMSIAAIGATLPVTASMFGQYSLIAPLSNVLAAPFFSLLSAGGLFLCLVCLLFQPLSFLLTYLFALAELFCKLLEVLSQFKFAGTAIDAPLWFLSVVVGVSYILLLSFWPKPQKKIARGILLVYTFFWLALLFIAPLSHGDEIIMLDIGQGDAFVLRSGGRSVLIDTGQNDAAVLKGLARHNVNHLDAVLITHPDADHCAALSAVLSFVEVENVLVAADLLKCSCTNCSRLREAADGWQIQGLNKGDIFTWGSFQAQVLAPKRFCDQGGNRDSVVLDISIDQNGDGLKDLSAFFCGDAESEVLGSLASEHLLVHTDILKVGHHGSAGAFTPEQLAILSPKVALISVGEQNAYGHPRQETLDMLEHDRIVYYRSDLCGDVVCKIQSKSFSIETLR